MDDLDCPADASSIDDCKWYKKEHRFFNCESSKGVYLECSHGSGFHLTSQHHLKYREGYVCEGTFSTNSARMACKMMGYKYVQQYKTTYVGSRTFSMDDF